MKKNNTPPIPDLPDSPDFRLLLELLLGRSNATNRMEALQADLNANFLTIVEVVKDEWADLQQLLADYDPKIEELCQKHPEWFGKKKSITTLVGTVKFHASSVLEVKNEEASVILIETFQDKDRELHLGKGGSAEDTLPLDNLIKTVKVLNIEALELLDDELLKIFRIKRVGKENFSVAPAKVNITKAVNAKTEETTTASREC